MRTPTLWFLLSSVACAGGASQTGTAASAQVAVSPSSQRNPDIITEAEIGQQRDVLNAFDLVRRLRPNFLRVQERTSLRNTAAAPLVRLNGQLMGEVSELRGIELSRVREIRYYSIVQAESQFSGDRGRPVINVTTRQ